MRIIAVTNRKGGVGKSTMSSHIAAGLATLGHNIGLVDTDSQGHAGMLLAMPEENGLYDALIRKLPLPDVLRLVPVEQYSTPDQPSQGNLYLLPSSDLTYRVPFELHQEEAFLFLEKLEEMSEIFKLDAIIIDTNPTMSMFDGAVFLAADDYIYVTECERLSIDGVQTAINQMTVFGRQRMKYLRRESRVMGIIPNKFRANTLIHRENIGAIARHFGSIVWPPVTLRTAWVEAANLRELVYTYAPSGQEARDGWDIVRRTVEALQWQPGATS
jgi:chromosome partitioning protein